MLNLWYNLDEYRSLVNGGADDRSVELKDTVELQQTAPAKSFSGGHALIAMLQPADITQPVAIATTSENQSVPVKLATSLSGSWEQAAAVEDQAMVLGALVSESGAQDAASNCVQCPTSLGNPSSILPFLTAQANSVISMASRKEAGIFADGITSATHASGSFENSEVSRDSDLSVGLDLGNGWKVVGLASLATQTSASAQPQQVLGSNLHNTEMPTTTSFGSATSSASDLNMTGFNANMATSLSPSLRGEWKIVGVTSLNPDDAGETQTVRSEVSCDTDKTSIPLPKSDMSAEASTSTGMMNKKYDNPTPRRMQNCNDPDVAKSLHSDLKLPSLADLASGTSDWKIAGITTLPVSADPAPATEDEKKTTTTPVDCSVGLPSVPSTTAADTSEWKVVGMTSMNASPGAPLVPSMLTPIPVVMASPSPLVTVPIQPVAVAGDEGWKVVGVVPLSPSGHSSDSQSSNIPPVSGTKEWPPTSMHQAVDSATQSLNERNEGQFPDRLEKKAWISTRLTRNTHNRKWVSDLFTQQAGISGNSGHPLAFLKNCSSQFKNTVLKKNTVSTMLELKRAFQNKNEDEKLVTVLARKKLLNLYNQRIFKQRSAFPECKLTAKPDDLNSDSTNILNASHVSKFSDRTMNSKSSIPHSESDKLLSPKQSSIASHFETDDKLVLSNAYRAQAEIQSNGNRASASSNTCFSFAYSHSSSQEDQHLSLLNENEAENRQTAVSSCFEVIKAEDGLPVMSLSNFDADNVNLTNVDPWGVCTDEDLGEIAEMMSEKGESKISHSSSRKRKLTTPRKMVQ